MCAKVAAKLFPFWRREVWRPVTSCSRPSPSTCAHPPMSAKNPTTRAVNALRSFLPPKPPPSLDTRAGNLYQVLSRHPNDGVGLKVHQTRWGEKGIARSYWKITRSSLKMEGRHGNAWGKLFWKGKFLSLSWIFFPSCVILVPMH